MHKDTIEFIQFTGLTLHNRDKPMPFTEGRYPFTYAYDYFRTHYTPGSMKSRGETGAFIRRHCQARNLDFDQVVEDLADLYMAEWNIVRPEDTSAVTVPTRKVRAYDLKAGNIVVDDDILGFAQFTRLKDARWNEDVHSVTITTQYGTSRDVDDDFEFTVLDV